MRRSYRDIVDILPDSSTGDAPQPSYTTTLYRDVPCEIRAVGGGERYRGRQIEAGIDYVVEMHALDQFTNPRAILYVKGGPFVGRTLNVTRILPSVFDGRAPKMVIDCKELVST